MEVSRADLSRATRFTLHSMAWTAGRECGLHCDFTRCGSDPLEGHVNVSKVCLGTCGVDDDEWLRHKLALGPEHFHLVISRLERKELGFE